LFKSGERALRPFGADELPGDGAAQLGLILVLPEDFRMVGFERILSF